MSACPICGGVNVECACIAQPAPDVDHLRATPHHLNVGVQIASTVELNALGEVISTHVRFCNVGAWDPEGTRSPSSPADFKEIQERSMQLLVVILSAMMTNLQSHFNAERMEKLESKAQELVDSFKSMVIKPDGG